MTSTAESSCLFCKIIKGDIPAQIVYQTESVTAFKDISPQAPVHYLVIPNQHTACVSETEDPLILQQVLSGARDLAQKESLTDYRLVVNNGAEAGQTVFHLHLHLLAGRPFTWPPG